jgi:hypothetical protein
MRQVMIQISWLLGIVIVSHISYFVDSQHYTSLHLDIWQFGGRTANKTVDQSRVNNWIADRNLDDNGSFGTSDG